MELLKYVYFYAQKSIIKAGNNKFQDFINAPRTARFVSDLVGNPDDRFSHNEDHFTHYFTDKLVAVNMGKIQT